MIKHLPPSSDLNFTVTFIIHVSASDYVIVRRPVLDGGGGGVNEALRGDDCFAVEIKSENSDRK